MKPPMDANERELILKEEVWKELTFAAMALKASLLPHHWRPFAFIHG